MSINRVKIIGVPISAINMDSCINNIFSNLEQIKGDYICVSNVHTTVMAHDNPDYMKVQSESYMSVPDGKPLSLIGRKVYPEMDRVTGPDLMRRLFNGAEFKNTRHYFYGNMYCWCYCTFCCKFPLSRICCFCLAWFCTGVLFL